MKNKRVKFTCYLIAAICYLSIAVTNFFGNLTAEGFLHLALGITNIILCIEYARDHMETDKIHNESESK